MINQVEDIITLLKEDIEIEKVKVIPITKYNSRYNINIICCEFVDSEMLEQYWKTLVDNVAIHIQANLDKDIELYNVYILFFAYGISNNLLYKIEQDRYSSRKIIIKQNMPSKLEEIQEIIEERLFKLNLEKPDNKELVIHDCVKNINKEFYDVIKKTDEIDGNMLENVLRILKCK